MHGAMRFGERMAKIGLTPPDAGVMGKIAAGPGISQQALAEHLGVQPSRMVALIDGLEEKGLVERVSSEEDRRTYALRLTARGQRTMGEIMKLGAEHDERLCAGLNEKERGMLVGLLEKMVREQGLTPGVHPGFKWMGKK
jgi:DNA-binding MarR family transcriptional regulator